MKRQLWDSVSKGRPDSGLWLLSAGSMFASLVNSTMSSTAGGTSRGDFRRLCRGWAAYRRAYITSAIAQPTMGRWLTASGARRGVPRGYQILRSDNVGEYVTSDFLSILCDCRSSDDQPFLPYTPPPNCVSASPNSSLKRWNLFVGGLRFAPPRFGLCSTKIVHLSLDSGAFFHILMVVDPFRKPGVAQARCDHFSLFGSRVWVNSPRKGQDLRPQSPRGLLLGLGRFKRVPAAHLRTKQSLH